MKKKEIVMDNTSSVETLYQDARLIIERARNNAVRSVDFSRVQMYWQLGKRIFEEEQQGKERADYGTYLIKNLAKQLLPEYGSGFGQRQLERARAFYRLYPIASTLRSQMDKAKIKKDAKAKGDEIEADTKAKLKKMIALWDEQTKVNKAIKAAKIKQEADTVHAIQNLTDEEVKHFLHEKWITPVQSGIIATASEVIETLIKQVEALSSKYAVSYNDLNAELVAAQDELSSFISDLTGDEYAIRGLNEFKNSLKG